MLTRSAEAANIKDFIESLPLKYSTKIGQDGIGLSKGQMQRILIARAVYKDPLYLMMDEATNALDSANESAIIGSLEKLLPGKTLIIAAHRLSTIKSADHIIVLNSGIVAEQGTHDELISGKGFYYNMLSKQLVA